MEAKNFKTVIEYAEGIRDGRIVANIERKKAADRFISDMKNTKYELDQK